MRLNNYINEDIDKFFIRIGPMSGQKQKHRNHNQAPARKGIWLLPVQAKKYGLSFLGGYVGDEEKHRLKVKPEDYEKEFGMSYDEFCELPYQEMERLENKVLNRLIKKHYKKIKLKPTDMIWTHMGKGIPDKDFGGHPWYRVSVREYWKLFKKTFGSELKKGWGFDDQFSEIFWETT